MNLILSERRHIVSCKISSVLSERNTYHTKWGVVFVEKGIFMVYTNEI